MDYYLSAQAKDIPQVLHIGQRIGYLKVSTASVEEVLSYWYADNLQAICVSSMKKQRAASAIPKEIEPRHPRAFKPRAVLLALLSGRLLFLSSTLLVLLSLLLLILVLSVLGLFLALRGGRSSEARLDHLISLLRLSLAL